MRRSELIGLKLEDIDRERRLLRIVQGKNRKDRLVPIGQRALGWLDKYLSDVRPCYVNEPTDTLFLNSSGRPLHGTNLTLLVRASMTAVGISKRGSCHMLRHTAATLLRDGGADLRSLQTLLGHEHLNTTELYTHLTLKQLRDVHDRTHPAERPPREAERRTPEPGQEPNEPERDK